jgi:chemotaxis signal transduction protein
MPGATLQLPNAKTLERRYLRIQIGNQSFALPLARVQEILELPPITIVPKTEGWLLGVIHLRGTIYSVVDIAPFLACALQPPSPTSRLVIIGSGALALALQVDAVLGIADVFAEDISHEGQAPTDEQPLIAGVGRQGGSFFNMLDVEALLNHPQLTIYM